VPKQRRAELHEALARRPDAGGDELVGYHLGEAYRNLRELGVQESALGVEAAERLAAAARTALMRGDAPAGARLLERAESLLEPGEAARDQLLPAFGAALFDAGRFDEATRVLDEAIARMPDGHLRGRADIEREIVRLETEPSAGSEQGLRVVADVSPVLERAGDDHGLARMGLLRGELAWNAGQVGDAEEAWRGAAEHARRAGDEREVFTLVGWRALAAAFGPAPVDEAIAHCEELRSLVRSSPLATASTLNPLALLHAMRGEFDVADALLEEASAMLEEIGGLGAGVSHLEAAARILAGRPELVESRLREDVETLSAMGEGTSVATTTALLAQAVYAQGRLDEAAELSEAAQVRAASQDIVTQTVWRGVLAKVFAHHGRAEEGEALARDAVALIERTDLLSHRGDAMLDLAEVLWTGGRRDEAEPALHQGLALYEKKGNTAACARARSLLAN
jgi:tetratricopeptide (TPR) repeat protein